MTTRMVPTLLFVVRGMPSKWFLILEVLDILEVGIDPVILDLL